MTDTDDSAEQLPTDNDPAAPKEWADRFNLRLLEEEEKTVLFFQRWWDAYDSGRGKTKKWTKNRTIRWLLREGALATLGKMGGVPKSDEEREEVISAARALGERVRKEKAKKESAGKRR